MPTSDNNRSNKLPREVFKLIASAPDAHMASGMFAGLSKLYDMIDDEDTRLLATRISLWITIRFGEDMKQDEKWSHVIRRLQQLHPAHREQCIAFLETERFTPLADRDRPFAFFRRDKWYRLVWNGHDDFDTIRVK